MHRSLALGVTALTAVAVVAATAGSGLAATYDPAVSQPRRDPYYPAKGDPSVDALHYGLHLRWSPKARTLHGTAAITFRATADESVLRLDLGNPLKVRTVRLDGRPVRHSHRGNDLVVRAGRTLAKNSRHRLTVVYDGTPHGAAAPTDRSDIPHVGWTTTRAGEVWTMQEPYGAFTWFPVNDHPSDKAYYDAVIKAPRRWVGIFNGTMVSRTTTKKHTVTRWHLGGPAASYLTTLAIGDYVRHRDRGPHQLPISYWVPRGSSPALLAELRRTPGMIRWLESKLGRYPFSRLGAVVVPSDSAMETQTLVTMGGKLLTRYGRQLFRADLLHEYAHQWYGDTVTPDNWKDLWLNESFAMYTQIRWEISRGWSTMDDWRTYLAEVDGELRSSDGPPGAYHRLQFGDSCVYYCGALMLDRLRTKLGVATFNTVWREWPQQHRFANADRADYISWLDGLTGRDLGPFVTSWLTSATTPAG